MTEAPDWTEKTAAEYAPWNHLLSRLITDENRYTHLYVDCRDADRRDYKIMLCAQRYPYTVASQRWLGEMVTYRGLPARRFVVV